MPIFSTFLAITLVLAFTWLKPLILVGHIHHIFWLTSLFPLAPGLKRLVFPHSFMGKIWGKSPVDLKQSSLRTPLNWILNQNPHVYKATCKDSTAKTVLYWFNYLQKGHWQTNIWESNIIGTWNIGSTGRLLILAVKPALGVGPRVPTMSRTSFLSSPLVKKAQKDGQEVGYSRL